MTNILIVGAMLEEVEKVQDWLQGEQKTTKRHHPLSYWVGTSGAHTLYLVQSGIGKVAAGVSVSALLDAYPIDFILNVGSAGGLQAHQEVGDLVLATATGYHDADVTSFGYTLGQLPQMPATFATDGTLLTRAEVAAQELKLPYHTGLILSGDSFVHTTTQVKTITTHFPEAICVEMEAAAIGQVAHLYGIPYLVVRSLSDKADAQAPGDFSAFLAKASLNSSQLIQKIINSL